MSDTPKTPEQAVSDQSAEQVNELQPKAVSDQDAEAVKGGATLYGKIIEYGKIIDYVQYKPQ